MTFNNRVSPGVNNRLSSLQAEEHNVHRDAKPHALISTSKEIGTATGILPVVSTLTFGFAAEFLLGQEKDNDSTATIILMSLSACCSLYTTTYSVLEFYYVAMLTAGDTKSAYMDIEGDTGQYRGLEQLDDLARQVDAMTMAFEPWRALARDCLWYSVVLIMAASFSKTIEKRNILRADTLVILLILVAGMVIVPVTVYKFRSNFRELLGSYRLMATVKPRTAKHEG